MIIDFSAHDTWAFCPAKWYERYINKRIVRWPKALRNDALCLGSLVHEGLRVWQQEHQIRIPDGVVEEVTPDRDTFDLAQELVYGYARTYPSEIWPLIFCEEPLTFPLPYFEKGEESTDSKWDLTGLAKIDSYFYVPELTVIESGVPGQLMALNPGWWIHEYKTKSSDIPIGLYMQMWEMNLQASYQVMALTHKLQSEAKAKDYSVEWPQVQGVLVNVLEKPKRYIPKRKCLKCDEYHEYATWIPTGTGEHACPVCGNRQKLKSLDQVTPSRPPNFYRIVVTRDQKQLDFDREQIILVGKQMMAMETGGLTSAPWTKKNCVEFKWKKACEYFGPHLNGRDTRALDEYVDAPEYRGLVEITT